MLFWGGNLRLSMVAWMVVEGLLASDIMMLNKGEPVSQVRHLQ